MYRLFLIPFLMVLLVGATRPGLATNTPTIELEKTVHFLTPGGEDVLLEPGTYEVEATDTGLKLLPVGGASTDVILLEATVGDHEETVETPTARFNPAEDQEDVIHLVLLFPDGRRLDALGTYSGIRPRGARKFRLQRSPRTSGMQKARRLQVPQGKKTEAVSMGTKLFTLPFKGEDLRDDERVYWHREIHSSGGVQKYGYDLDIRRYSPSQKKWESKSGSTNKDWYVHGTPVYAMQSGKIIACWRNAPENPKTGTGEGKWHQELTKYPDKGSRIYGGGNGFWIEHADGSRAEYAHFMPGTVPSSLCPHNVALLPAVIASPAVGHAWKYIRVPENKQMNIKQGQFLGKAGNVGTSSNPHLHIHLEEGGQANTKKQGGSPVSINFRSGLYTKYNDKGPYVTWQSFAGKPIPPGPVLVWPSRSMGKEYARHKYLASRFGAMFQHLTDSGFWPEWIDGYSVGGTSYLNFVWRPAKGAWRAFFLLSGQDYQKHFNQALKDKYSPVFVDSSLSGGKVRYSVIFVKNKPGGVLARHGLTYDQHTTVMDQAKKEGLVPVNVSVVSVGGQRKYTVLYRSGNIGRWQVKSRVPEAGYQQLYNENSQQKRKPLYVNAYMHKGKPYYTVIFSEKPKGARKDRHGMEAQKYQQEFISAHKAGLLTRAVSGYDGARKNHRFIATWRK